MIQRPENGTDPKKTHVYGFLLGIELEEGVNINDITNLLSDAVKFHEGTGEVTVDLLGEIEFVEEPRSETLTEWEQLTTKQSN